LSFNLGEKMSGVRDMSTAVPPLQDPVLIERSIAGDRSARERLAGACLPRVRRTVFMLVGRSEDAEDLVQISLARIFGGLASFRSESQLTTWMDRITVNTVREHFRRRPLVSLFPAGEWQETADQSGRQEPDRRLDGKRMMELLRSHLSSVRMKKRTALVLSAAYGYTVSEIAEMTGCTTETAKKRLQHGRRELLARLRKDPCLSAAFEEIES
jgi:RNA polymerase sigma-70 factor (ECF subfamily)